LYSEELLQFQKAGIVEVFAAFSREREIKQYVQHLLVENGQRVWDIIMNNNGRIYVCGDAKAMAQDVHEALTKVFTVCGNVPNEVAAHQLQELMNGGRYQRDVW